MMLVLEKAVGLGAAAIVMASTVERTRRERRDNVDEAIQR